MDYPGFIGNVLNNLELTGGLLQFNPTAREQIDAHKEESEGRIFHSTTGSMFDLVCTVVLPFAWSQRFPPHFPEGGYSSRHWSFDFLPLTILL